MSYYLNSLEAGSVLLCTQSENQMHVVTALPINFTALWSTQLTDSVRSCLFFKLCFIPCKCFLITGKIQLLSNENTISPPSYRYSLVLKLAKKLNLTWNYSFPLFTKNDNFVCVCVFHFVSKQLPIFFLSFLFIYNNFDHGKIET